MVTSTYDDNDRILTEGVNTYTYDLNGNTLTATKAGVTTNHSYDYQNRLDAVLLPLTIPVYQL